MPSPSQIRRVREVLVYENRFVSIFDDEVVFPSGQAGRYIRVHNKPDLPGVVILPVRAGAVGLVRQYRYAVGASMWELPRGMGDGADPEVDARRELLEETGAEPESMVYLGATYGDSGLSAVRVELFLARLAPESRFDAVDEVDAARWVPVPEALAMVADGSLTDGYTCTALARAHLRGLLDRP